MGNCLVSLGGKGWGIDAWPCGGDGGWRFSGRRMWVVEFFGPFTILPVPLLSLYSPYPLACMETVVSHTSCTPYFPL